MALPIVSLLSLKPQFGHSSFCHNVSSISTRTYYFSPPKLHLYFWNILSHCPIFQGIVVDIRELNNLPCPCNSTFRMLPHVFSPSMKSYNSVLASTFGTGTRVHSVLSSPPVRWQIGTASMFSLLSHSL
ncbi:hypothetical protein CK203_018679 [Vitis vinifera]|uniref:Uncharacterized protein n=1 Tax=Vitis vinifera TaxID=29760 RepID=A0A438JAP2_VITVI|nr:hypothetical protein CK203_018679 [Vitis vinifera]